MKIVFWLLTLLVIVLYSLQLNPSLIHVSDPNEIIFLGMIFFLGAVALYGLF